MSRAGKDQGLSLLELVVVMAIFSLVATIGLQSISGTLRARDRLVQTEADTSRMAMAITLMRNDLKAAVPVAFHPPGGEARSALQFDAQKSALAFSVGGQPSLLGEETAGLARVIWRYDPASQQLLRQVWPVLTPLESSIVSPEIVALNNVKSFDIRTFTSAGGWVSAANISAFSYSSSLPAAVEIKLNTEKFGLLRIVVAF